MNSIFSNKWITKSKSEITVIITHAKIFLIKTVVSNKIPYILGVTAHPIDHALAISENLFHVLKKTRKKIFSGSWVTVLLASDVIDQQKILLPKLNPKDLDLAVKTHMESDTQTHWFYMVQNEVEKSGSPHVDILITKARISDLNAISAVFKEFRIPLTKIMTRDTAICLFAQRLLIHPHRQTVLLVELDEKILTILLLISEKIVFYRQIKLGFQEFFKAVSHLMSKEESGFETDEMSIRQLLSNFDLFSTEVESGSLQEQLFVYIRPVLEKMSIEIKKSVSFYFKQYGEIPIANCYLLGAFLTINNIKSYFAKEFPFPFEKSEIQPDCFHFQKKSSAGYSQQEFYELALGATSALIHPLNRRNLLSSTIEKKLNQKRFAGFSIATTAVFLIAFGFLSWIISQSVIFEKNKISDYEKQLKILSIQKDLLLQQHQIGEQKAQFLKIIQSILAQEKPAANFLYDLSQISSKEITMTKISIDNQQISLSGRLIQSQLYTDLPHYIQKLEALPYLSNVKFNIKEEKNLISSVEINANFKETH